MADKIYISKHSDILKGNITKDITFLLPAKSNGVGLEPDIDTEEYNELTNGKLQDGIGYDFERKIAIITLKVKANKELEILNKINKHKKAKLFDNTLLTNKGKKKAIQLINHNTNLISITEKSEEKNGVAKRDKISIISK